MVYFVQQWGEVCGTHGFRCCYAKNSFQSISCGTSTNCSNSSVQELSWSNEFKPCTGNAKEWVSQTFLLSNVFKMLVFWGLLLIINIVNENFNLFITVKSFNIFICYLDTLPWIIHGRYCWYWSLIPRFIIYQ